MKRLSLIISIIMICTCMFLSCTTPNDTTKYYKVENFEILDTIPTKIIIPREGRSIKKIYVYKLNLIDENNDTIMYKYGSEHNMRFVKGDTVYYNKYMDKYQLK